MPFIRSQYFVDSPTKATKFLTQTLGFTPALAQKTIDKARLRIGIDARQIAQKSDILQGIVWLTHFSSHYYEASELIKPIFCTQDFALFDKPPKLLTHPKGNFLHKSLLDSIRFFCGDEAQSVHRLDFETSGAILIAKHKKAQIALKTALMNRKIHKCYLAKVRGEIKSECLINAPIITPTRTQKSQNLSIRSKIDYAALKSNATESSRLKSSTLKSSTLKSYAPKSNTLQSAIKEKSSKSAITRIVPIHFDGEHTFIKAFPFTGRTHQIRLHLAHIGHTIENDFLYGVSDEVSERYLDELRTIRAESTSHANIDTKSTTKPNEKSNAKSKEQADSKNACHTKEDLNEICNKKCGDFADKVLALHSFSVDFCYEGVRYMLSAKAPAWWQAR